MDESTAEDILGLWWDPQRPDRRVAGRLRFPADGPIDLDLMEALFDGSSEATYPVILGVSAEGTRITLEHAVWIGGYDRRFAAFLPELAGETLMVRAAYVGAHLIDADDRRFTDGSVDFTDLSTWALPATFETVDHQQTGYEVRVTLPESSLVKLPFGTVTFARGWRARQEPFRSHLLDVDAGVSVHLDEPAGLEDWLNRVIGPLRHLLTFATDRPNEVRTVTLVPPNGERGERVIARYPRAQVEASTKVRPWEYVFDASSLGSELPSVVARWFSLIAELGPVVNLSLAQRYRPNVFAESRFLDACIATEAYHRARNPSSEATVVEHEARVAAILAVAPEYHRTWLEARLQYGYEPSLRSRLKDLVRNAAIDTADLFGRPAEFAESVVATRSTLVHDPMRRLDKALNGRDLVRMAEQLTLLVSAYLLRDLGFDDSSVNSMLTRTRRYRRLKERVF